MAFNLLAKSREEDDMEDKLNEVRSKIEEWIEPEIRDLDVRETAFNSGFGSDGGGPFADCGSS